VIVAKTKLDQFKGRLSPAQITAGINAATQNAKRLFEDALILFNDKRYPSAASLAILSIEESGKVSILRELALAKNDKAVLSAWQAYRSHTKKNVNWLLPQLAARGARRLDDFSPLFDKDAEHPFLLDQIKQLGFYTDCLANAHWSIPVEVVDEPLSKMLVEIAKIFAKNRETTIKEIELWIKHVGPVWMTNAAWMKKALANWYGEMQQLGLAPEGKNAMEEFVRQGFGSL
jgi:AbiV family abortive infection protein